MKPEDTQVNKRQLIRFTNFKSLKHSSSVTVSSCYGQQFFHQMVFEEISSTRVLIRSYAHSSGITITSTLITLLYHGKESSEGK
jgi:hypothetical protein